MAVRPSKRSTSLNNDTNAEVCFVEEIRVGRSEDRDGSQFQSKRSLRVKSIVQFNEGPGKCQTHVTKKNASPPPLVSLLQWQAPC